MRSSPDVWFPSLEVAWDLKRMMDISVDYSIVLSSMIALLARCDVLGLVPHNDEEAYVGLGGFTFVLQPGCLTIEF